MEFSMETGKVIEAAIAYFENDIRRISHLLKVYGFAKAIGEKEQLDLFTMECLETAAVLHDIGIKISEEKYQSSAGKYQELEGPPVAAVILKKLEFPAPVTERVAYLIGHHHTYDKIEGMDYQILVEADFLVNINEDGLDSSKQGLDSIRKIKENIFKTKTGTKILESIYLSKVKKKNPWIPLVVIVVLALLMVLLNYFMLDVTNAVYQTQQETVQTESATAE